MDQVDGIPSRRSKITTGVLLKDHRISPDGSIAPSKGDNLILLNMYGLFSLQPHEVLLNLVGVIAHEILHACGFVDGPELMEKELEVLASWLEIIFPEKRRQALIEEAARRCNSMGFGNQEVA